MLMLLFIFMFFMLFLLFTFAENFAFNVRKKVSFEYSLTNYESDVNDVNVNNVDDLNVNDVIM